MSPGLSCLRPVAAALGALLLLPAALAVPLQPRADDEVIERLPPRTAAAAARPGDVAAAVNDAAAWLAASQAQGDPRPAGRALGRLQPWANDPGAPAPVVVMLASVEQHLHRFDSAERRLRALVARDGRQPQAWLTLATLARLRGDYAASDAACRALQPLPGGALPAAACLAENQGLRGEVAAARARFGQLLAAADPGLRGWLWTSLGELEARAGRPAAAERALRAALAATPGDGYAAIVLADLLIDAARPADALHVLDAQPASDAVLLRRVQAGRALRLAQAEADAAELRRRFAQAALRGAPAGLAGARDAGAAPQRPDAAALQAAAAATGHAREAALYAWQVEGDAALGLRLARLNLAQQREPFDLLLFTRLARATGDAAALREAADLQRTLGLHDERLADAS